MTRPSQSQQSSRRISNGTKIETPCTFPHVKGWRPKAPLIEYGGHWFVQPLLKSSLYAHKISFKKQMTNFGPLNSLEECFDVFCRGFSGNGPYLDHVLEYWKAYQENPEHILFLKYEKVRADPLPYVKRLIQFMGLGFTVEEEKKRVVEKLVNLCSLETLKNLEVNEGERIREDVPLVGYPNCAYFRKGNYVGDWHNYLTLEMAARINGLMQEKLKGSGLLEHDKLTG